MTKAQQAHADRLRVGRAKNAIEEVVLRVEQEHDLSIAELHHVLALVLSSWTALAVKQEREEA